MSALKVGFAFASDVSAQNNTLSLRLALAAFEYWLGNTKILKHAQFLCQFYELRKLNTPRQLELKDVASWRGLWFGQHTDIAFLVSLSFWFYHTNSLYCVGVEYVFGIMHVLGGRLFGSRRLLF